MGVKSTYFITREAAESRWLDAQLEFERQRMMRWIKAMTDEELEDELEQLNDAQNGGEGFENYIIGKEDE